MSKLSPQSKSFIILFSLAVIGSYLCLMLWADMSIPYKGFNDLYPPYQTIPEGRTINQNSNTQTQETVPPVDTSDWKTYTNPQYNLSFKYPSDWKILPASKKSGFTIIQIDPGKKFYNIKIYINPNEFYVMNDLPIQQENIDGQQALNVKNLLYGIKANGNYYTFDIGLSLSLTPKFVAMVHSVKFE